MKKLMALAVAGVVSASVRAADVYVSSTGTYGPDGAAKYTDLADAVAAAAAGDTVWIEDGYVYESNASLATMGSTKCRILVSKAITLRSASGDATKGGGATIRGAWHDSTTPIGANAVRALGIKTTGVVLRGLVLENGATASGINGGGGLALSGAARVAVTNCVVRNCTGAMGGGVYISNDDFLTLSGCVVTNNASLDNGAGLCTYGMRDGAGAYVVDTLIAGNTCASRGGGINGGKGLVLDSCVVSNNVASKGGGMYSVFVAATNSHFIANFAGSGGGVNAEGNSTGVASFFKCIFEANVATNAQKTGVAGALLDSSSIITLESCLVAGNLANTAGGVYGGKAIRDTVISNNCAVGGNPTSGNCGGVNFLVESTLSGSTVIHNTSEKHGGGICTTADKPVVISGSQIVGNYAGGYGGGAMAPSAMFTNTVVASNCAVSNGGGVYGSQKAAQMPVLRDCVVTNNAASANGGAANGGGLWSAVAYGSDISDNSTIGSGAGAWDCVLTGCTLTDNEARDSGSASCFGGGARNGFATNCVFSGNTALRTGPRNDSGGGGGAYNVSGSGNVFSGNRARLGGGVFLTTGNTLANCAISNNVANTNGGGVYGTGSVYNSLVVDNSLSDASGGAAAAGASGEASSAPYKLVLVNCTVAGNDGGVSRGGLYQVAITNTISWANLGDDDSKVSPAVSSCAAILTAGEDGNINSDPKLAADWTLGKRSPCIDAATRFDWMTTANDVRSLDVFAKPRVNGEPDMGAAEFYPVVRGLMLLLR